MRTFILVGVVLLVTSSCSSDDSDPAPVDEPSITLDDGAADGSNGNTNEGGEGGTTPEPAASDPVPAGSDTAPVDPGTETETETETETGSGVETDAETNEEPDPDDRPFVINGPATVESDDKATDVDDSETVAVSTSPPADE